jgi:CDP-glycerol glycerophosphotransferase (TagB/SpsB family)
LVDLSSDRLVDMSYTAAADIYLGDVSSQVYEFLLTPRPCLFVNAHGVEWKNDPDYAHWQLGEVVSPEGVIAAVARAKAEHPRFLDRQQSAVAETFSDIPDAALAASRAILSALPR